VCPFANFIKIHITIRFNYAIEKECYLMSIRGYIENLRYERERQQRKETALKVMSGLAIGTVIGGVIGTLFAPKAGKETRQEISEKVKETAAVTREKVKETVQEVKDKVEELKDKRLAMVDKKNDPAGGV
jgi:uncharacterized protein YcfJ